MKRYNIGLGHYDTGTQVDADEDPEGEWMRADEVLPRIAELEAQKAAVQGSLDRALGRLRQTEIVLDEIRAANNQAHSRLRAAEKLIAMLGQQLHTPVWKQWLKGLARAATHRPTDGR